MTAVIYTIGHSNHTSNELIDWLNSHAVKQLVDIRRHPGSRRLPQFNRGHLQRALSEAGIGYVWSGEALGGMRDTAVPVDSFKGLDNDSLQTFAAYMNTAAFRSAITDFLTTCQRERTAMMCAEKNPLQCHRQLISDYLALQGHEVMHINGSGTLQPHRIHDTARFASGMIHYDRGTQPGLDLE